MSAESSNTDAAAAAATAAVAAAAPAAAAPSAPGGPILRAQKMEPTQGAAPERAATDLIAEAKARYEAEAAASAAAGQTPGQIKRSAMRDGDDMYDETGTADTT